MPVHPTRRGVVVAGVGILAAVLGWFFGLPEASFAGAALVVAVVAALVTVLLGGPAAQVRRTARPDRLAVGERCEIVLDVRNDSSRSTRVTVLTDLVGDQGRAEVAVAPLRPGEHARATYSLPSERRGVHRLGPLVSRIEDPFGLARRVATAAGTSAVVIVPRAVDLAPLPAAVGDEPELGTHSMVASSTVDEEFTGLRHYVPGDDVRRIHWPSTARAGAAVVRQFEVPWQHRTTFLVDLRPSRHDRASFERAVVVAASVVARAAADTELLRFGSTLDPEPTFVPAEQHAPSLLEQLAVVEPVGHGPHEDDALLSAIERATRAPTGRLVVCAGRLQATESERIRAVASRAGLALVITTAAAPEGTRLTGTAVDGGPALVSWDGTTDLATCWRAAATGGAAAGSVVTAGRPR